MKHIRIDSLHENTIRWYDIFGIEYTRLSIKTRLAPVVLYRLFIDTEMNAFVGIGH